MVTVAIHQPNYVPWLGFFHKLAAADVFVFLEDVQYSKGSYINRVQILQDGKAAWLTIPVHVRFGQHIDAIVPARMDWVKAHLGSLYNAYKGAAGFRRAWESIERIYDKLPDASLARGNRELIERIARRLGLSTRFASSKDFQVSDLGASDRLIAITNSISPDAVYLSGQGGAKYQDPRKFAAAGLGFGYTGFTHPVYVQRSDSFIPGLSILDVVLHCGWEQAATLARSAAATVK